MGWEFALWKELSENAKENAVKEMLGVRDGIRNWLIFAA
jgi:hypothetical protein